MAPPVIITPATPLRGLKWLGWAAAVGLAGTITLLWGVPPS